MDKRSVPNGRERRALELWGERGRDVEWISPNLYLVPSSDGERTYRVDYTKEECDCDDAERRTNNDLELSCKHVYLVAIFRARKRAERRSAPRAPSARIL